MKAEGFSSILVASSNIWLSPDPTSIYYYILSQKLCNSILTVTLSNLTLTETTTNPNTSPPPKTQPTPKKKKKRRNYYYFIKYYYILTIRFDTCQNPNQYI